MKQIQILLIILLSGVFLSSCNEEKQTSNVQYEIMTLSENKCSVSLIDVETNNYLEATPAIIINSNSIDTASLISYLSSRSPSIPINKGNLFLSFKVSNKFNISNVGELISFTLATTENLNEPIKGIIYIELKYSSKGDDWLSLPPPPNY
ncbi:MAG: hypothetical protein KDC83_08000 [Flavobacteriales bacterium]|nr:hypothetical protein [Flavobacteriales bacterium]